MTERARELAERNAALRARCGLQRDAMADEVDGIVARFAAIDRVAAVTRNVLLHPAVIAAGAIALLAFGRARGLRLVVRVVLLANAARRLVRTARTL
jgi:hypothetical protein